MGIIALMPRVLMLLTLAGIVGAESVVSQEPSFELTLPAGYSAFDRPPGAEWAFRRVPNAESEDGILLILDVLGRELTNRDFSSLPEAEKRKVFESIPDPVCKRTAWIDGMINVVESRRVVQGRDFLFLIAQFPLRKSGIELILAAPVELESVLRKDFNALVVNFRGTPHVREESSIAGTVGRLTAQVMMAVIVIWVVVKLARKATGAGQPPPTPPFDPNAPPSPTFFVGGPPSNPRG